MLAIAGFVTAFYGVLVGLTQRHPKAVLAYSSVSQMGVVVAVLGLGLAAGDGTARMAAAFYAAHHVLVKGALFLAVGVAAAGAQGRRAWVLAPALLLCLGLGGLPFTGGAIAKYAVKDFFGTGVTAALSAASAAGTTLLMLHFLRPARARRGDGRRARAGGAAAAVAGDGRRRTAAALAAVRSGRTRECGGSACFRRSWQALWPVAAGRGARVRAARPRRRAAGGTEGDIAAGLGPAARVTLRLGARLDGLDRRPARLDRGVRRPGAGGGGDRMGAVARLIGRRDEMTVRYAAARRHGCPFVPGRVVSTRIEAAHHCGRPRHFGHKNKGWNSDGHMVVRPFAWIGVVAACGASLAGCQRGAPEAAEAEVRPVRSITIAKREGGSTIALSGRIAAEDEVALAFRIPGRLIERTVNVGDRVRPGQVIARLER